MTIAPHLATALGLAPQSHVQLAGPDGRHEAAAIEVIARVDVAGQSFRDVGVVVDWVEAPSPVACLSTDGLLGASLLRAAIWQVDFHAGRLTVTDDLSRLAGLEYAIRLPFQRADAAGSPRIEVDIGTIRGASLLVDLGFNGSLAMPPAMYREAGGTLGHHTPAQHGSGAATILGDGQSTLYIGRVDELRMGSLRTHDVPVLTGAEVSDFHVGVAFLKHFRVTIDWRNDEIYLQRRAPRSALFDRYPSYGFTPALRDGGLVVGALWRGGTAARAGLKVGDPITAIDGKSVVTEDFDAFCALLDAISLYGSGTAPVEVTVQRGAESLTRTVPRAPLLPAPSREPLRPSR